LIDFAALFEKARDGCALRFFEFLVEVEDVLD
jgi:hypothetical protein